MKHFSLLIIALIFLSCADDNNISTISFYFESANSLKDKDIKLSKETFKNLKQLVKKITLSQEDYAEKYGKNKSIESDSIKRKERIKNISIEIIRISGDNINREKVDITISKIRIKLLFIF